VLRWSRTPGQRPLSFVAGTALFFLSSHQADENVPEDNAGFTDIKRTWTFLRGDDRDEMNVLLLLPVLLIAVFRVVTRKVAPGSPRPGARRRPKIAFHTVWNRRIRTPPFQTRLLHAASRPSKVSPTSTPTSTTTREIISRNGNQAAQPISNQLLRHSRSAENGEGFFSRSSGPSPERSRLHTGLTEYGSQGNPRWSTQGRRGRRRRPRPSTGSTDTCRYPAGRPDAPPPVRGQDRGRPERPAPTPASAPLRSSAVGGHPTPRPRDAPVLNATPRSMKGGDGPNCHTR